MTQKVTTKALDDAERGDGTLKTAAAENEVEFTKQGAVPTCNDGTQVLETEGDLELQNVNIDENAESDVVEVEEETPLSFVCYCPITKEIMKDPVVHCSGDSYEKEAIMKREHDNLKGRGEINSDLYYPNRALKAFIERECEKLEANGTVMDKIHKLDDNLRTGWDKLTEHTGLPTASYNPLPDEFYCTLTLDLCHEPVIDPDGNTYERDAIIHWLLTNGESPITRKPMAVDQLYDNNAVLSILLEMSQKEDNELHPCIKKWKDELMGAEGPLSIVPVTNPDDPTASGQNNEDPDNALANSTRRGQYPTTYEEIENRMRQEHRASMITLVVVIVVVSFAVIYLPFYFVLVVLAFITCLYGRRRMYERQFHGY